MGFFKDDFYLLFVFLLLISLSLVFPKSPEIDDNLLAVFGATTFVFSLLVGFSIANMNTRSRKVIEASGKEKATLEGIYLVSESLGGKIKKDTINLIDKYLCELVLHEYEECSSSDTCFLEFMRYFEKFSELHIDKVKFNIIQNYFQDLIETRNEMILDMKIGLSRNLKLLIFILAAFLVFLSLNMQLYSIVSRIAAILFSFSIIFLVKILLDIESFKIIERAVFVDTLDDIFDLIGKPPVILKKHLVDGKVKLRSRKFDLTPGKEYRIIDENRNLETFVV